MKRLFTSAFLLMGAMTMIAIPAKKCWTKVVQADGTVIEVTLAGDENMHYYMTRDEVALARIAPQQYCYVQFKDGKISTSNILAHEKTVRTASEQILAVSANQLDSIYALKRLSINRAKSSIHRSARLSSENKDVFRGSKKAPVILAYFSDKSFAESDDDIRTFYDRVLNEKGFSEYGANGSVHDYFHDMSRGLFDLTFDVIGPVKVSKSATYYGGPSVLLGGTDHIGEFITEAIKKADEENDIDWKQYDWNGDGEVEQVFVLYAGYGQATGGPTGTIWPNAWTLDEALVNNDGQGGFSLGGVYINQYACSNELYQSSGKTKMGLGVFCHEFSHCMGLPDMYDTKYSNTPTMGDWDLLASGSYNGPNGIGWCPAGWTSYERAYAGWLNPIELQPNDTVTNMSALEDNDGQAYIIYNDNHKDEYYLLENHKNTGWDAYTPESGLLVIHVDYNKELFDNNIVNTKGTFTPAEGYNGTFTNDHPRMAPMSRVRSISNETYYYTFPMQTPRGLVDSLTNTSKPAATLYNEQEDGTKVMNKPIYNISKDSETGNISFVYMPKENGDITGITDININQSFQDDTSVYDLTGNVVGTYSDVKQKNLSQGLYIVRDNNKGKKIIIK